MTLPVKLRSKKYPQGRFPTGPQVEDERNIRNMERAYSEREEVMSPSRMDGREDDRNTPARQDYRLFKRLRSNRRMGGR